MSDFIFKKTKDVRSDRCHHIFLFYFAYSGDYGSWITTGVDCSKINEVMIEIAAAVPAVVFLLQQINTPPSTCYAIIDLVNLFFFSPYQSISPREAMCWQGYKYTFIALFQ